ncbi:hypothetical protein ACOMHN_000787 [Nucella lapillus]
MYGDTVCLDCTSSGCKGRAIIKDNQLRLSHQHSHPPLADDYLTIAKAKSVMKRKAEESASSLRDIYDATVRGEGVAGLLTYRNMESTMSKRRRKTYPPIPRNPDQAAQMLSTADPDVQPFSINFMVTSFKRLIHKYMALPLLPSTRIEEGLDELQNEAPQIPPENQRKLELFRRYVRSFWMQKATPSRMTVFGLSRRSNNSIESFHAMLKRKIGVAHPNFYVFIDHLNKVIESKLADLKSLDSGMPLSRRKPRQQLINEDRLRRLEQQLSEDEISAGVFLTNSWGTFTVLEPELVCMRELWGRGRWRYFINLTGQEFPLRTNRELVQILTAYQGANNLEATRQRANKDLWSRVAPPPGAIIPTKGSVHVLVNRYFVDFVLHTTLGRDFLHWSQQIWVPDEVFFSTLNHNPHLGIRGTYTGEAETHPTNYPFLTRFKNWGSYPFSYPCSGKFVRQICILTSGDLPLLTRAVRQQVLRHGEQGGPRLPCREYL